MHKCNKKVSHLLILNGHFCFINVTKTSVLFSYLYAVYAVKRTNSILTGDWRFCYIFTVKRTISILTAPVNVEWSFLLHKCKKKVSHLLIFNWSFLLHRLHKSNQKVSHLPFNINRWLIFLLHFCIKKDKFNINRWLTFFLHLCSLCSKKDQFNINRWLTHKCNKKFCHLLILKWSFLL
jgi:hypothetical protein